MKRNRQNIERTCEVCGKEFITKTARQLTCSLECSEEKHRRYAREYREKQKKELEAERNKECKCSECGRKFKRTYKKQVSCSKECQIKREKRLKKERSSFWRTQVRKEKINENEPTDLVSKAREARSKGLSYGKLMELEMIEREKQNKKRRHGTDGSYSMGRLSDR